MPLVCDTEELNRKLTYNFDNFNDNGKLEIFVWYQRDTNDYESWIF